MLTYGGAPENYFQYNPDPLFKKVYDDRISPYKNEYKDLNNDKKVDWLTEEEDLAYYMNSVTLKY